MNNREKVYNVLSHVLNINIESINESTSPSNTESWDSFNALMLISEFESTFNLTFTMQEVADVSSVKDIINVLKNKGIEFSDE